MTDPKAELIGVTTLLIVLITLFVAVRAFVRIRIFRSVWWDDGLVFLSYSLAITLCSSVLNMTNYGFGTPFAQVTPEQFQKFRMARPPINSPSPDANCLKFQFITQLSYVWAFVTVKMSFAVLYFRLLPSDLSRRMNQVLLVVLALEGIVATLVVSLQCIPLQKAWNPALDGACLDLRTFYYISFGVKLITDICLFVQPIPAVWGLPLSLEKRIGAILMLSLGLFVCIIAVIRVSVINRLGKDITVSLVVPMLWSQAEVCALIICATIPTFRPFVRYFPSVSKALGLSSPESEWERVSSIRQSRIARLIPPSVRIRAAELHIRATGPFPQTIDCEPDTPTMTPGLAPYPQSPKTAGPSETIIAREIDVVLGRSGGDWVVTDMKGATPESFGHDVEAALNGASSHKK